MSRQSLAKLAQGYTLEKQECQNCASFRSDVIEHPPHNEWGRAWSEEKNLRCAVGGFKVHKRGTCKAWMPIPMEKL